MRRLFYRLFKPKRHAYYDEMLEHQGYGVDAVLNHQNETVRELVLSAYNHTEFYKKKYDDSGVGRSILDGSFQISQLPILTKADLRSNIDSLIIIDGNEKDSLLLGKTSGSTGEPVKFYVDNNTIEKMHAAQWRFYAWCDWQPGEKILHFWGASQDISTKHNFKSILVEWLTGEKFIGVYEFDGKTMLQWLNVIESYKPVILQGYATLLAVFAKYILDNKIHVNAKLKGIYSTAEVLYPDQRELIEKVFQCKVFNQYGCREIPAIACECKQGNMHLFTDMAYVETVHGKSNNIDELIITSLSNNVMPIIRYKLGDQGKLKEGGCSCGSPFPLMEMGLCRTNDIITLKDGRNIYPAYFNRLLDGIKEIDKYQFHQTDYDSIILYIISNENNDASRARLDELDTKIKNDLDSSLMLKIKYVDKIPKTKAGKYRFVVSDIN